MASLLTILIMANRPTDGGPRPIESFVLNSPAGIIFLIFHRVVNICLNLNKNSAVLMDGLQIVFVVSRYNECVGLIGWIVYMIALLDGLQARRRRITIWVKFYTPSLPKGNQQWWWLLWCKQCHWWCQDALLFFFWLGREYVYGIHKISPQFSVSTVTNTWHGTMCAVLSYPILCGPKTEGCFSNCCFRIYPPPKQGGSASIFLLGMQSILTKYSRKERTRKGIFLLRKLTMSPF